MADFDISLLITTYNWEDALARVLKSVAEQTLLPKEVIVADDGSKEPTRLVVNEFQKWFPVPLIHSWQEDKGFRLAASRNRAIAASSSEYLIMIDGDMVLDKKFIASHKKFARKNSFVTGSRVMLCETRSKAIIKNEASLPHFFSKGISSRFNTINCPMLSNVCSGFKGTKSCNMALWKEDAIRINGFNSDFEGWGAEDTDFARRLMNSGVVRRKFKFGGVAYHLYHKKNDRSSFLNNREILSHSINEKIIRCENGLDKFLSV
jgi:glycosyltransferase involved in cell wall biosynthesis